MPTKLFKYAELPTWRQDNPSILTGYRGEKGSWLGCLRTVGEWHNESINIWTHFAGMVVSLFVIMASDTDMESIFLLGCIVCFSCSALFHTSLCHSEEVVKWTNRMDYFGILALGTVNYCPTFHYAFFCDPHYRNVYIVLMMLSGTVGTYLVCAPTYASPAYRRMRTYTFFSLGFVTIFPFLHAVSRYGLDELSEAIALKWLSVEALAYIVGALMYAERCPECLAPGYFDFLGSSHQIFHVCSLVAVCAHYLSLVEARHYRYFLNRGTCTSHL